MPGGFNEQKSTTTLSGKVYLQNLINKLEPEIGVLKNYTVPLDPEYRPELDDSPLLGETESSHFRMLTGGRSMGNHPRMNGHSIRNYHASKIQHVP